MRFHRRYDVSIAVLLSLFVLIGCAPSPKTYGPFTPEDTGAKTLTPPSGKALVYFFYGRIYSFGNIEVMLDGAASAINGGMYVLWEVPAGEYTMEFFLPGRTSLDAKTATLSIAVEAGQKLYFRSISHSDESPGADRTPVYRITPIRASNGQQYVNAYALISWFRDGTLIYENLDLLKKRRVER